MNVYKCFMTGKQPVEIHTDAGSYDAQKRAAILWKISEKKRHQITVALVAKDGVAIVHSTSEL